MGIYTTCYCTRPKDINKTWNIKIGNVYIDFVYLNRICEVN